MSLGVEDHRTRDSCVMNSTLLELEEILQKMPFASEIETEGIGRLPPEHLEKLLFFAKETLLKKAQSDASKEEAARSAEAVDRDIQKMDDLLLNLRTEEKMLEEAYESALKEHADEVKKEAACRQQKVMQSMEHVRRAEKLETEKKREAIEEERLRGAGTRRA